MRHGVSTVHQTLVSARGARIKRSVSPTQGRARLRNVGDRKRKRGARAAVVRLGPKTALMSLDDRTAHKQPDAHAAAFRGVEGIEQRVLALWREAHAGVTNGQTYAVAVLTFGLDPQVSRSIVHVDHRVRGVTEQVQDDLLKLDTIAGDVGEVVGEFRLQNDAISLKIVRRQRNDLSRRLVQIQRLGRELPLAEQRAETRDYVRGAVGIANRTP